MTIYPDQQTQRQPRLGTRILLFCIAAGAIYRLGEDHNVQPAHILIPFFTIFLATLAITRKSKFKFTTFQIIIMTTCGIFFFRNMVDTIFFGQTQIISNALYWINFITLFALLTHALTEIEWKYLSKYLLINVLISAIFSMYQFFTDFPIRAKGLSGTENHLALQIIHTILILKATSLNTTISTFSLRILGLSTLSRAYVVYQVLNIFIAQHKIKYIIGALALGTLTITIISENFSLNSAAEKFNQIEFISDRFSISENQSDKDGRGYKRIITSPEYFIYGASEAIREFPEDPFYGQIHSNFISISFCFGLAGIIFSYTFFHQLIKRTGLAIGILYALYSLTLYFYSNIIFLIFVACIFRKNHAPQ